MVRDKSQSPFDDLAERYDEWFDKQGSLIFRIEAEAFDKILGQLPRPWVEIGVGSGRFADFLGIKYGIDPSIKLIQMARNRGISAHLAVGQNLPFESELFGSVFLIVTICFLDSPAEVLREVYRTLKPHGKIVLGLVLEESPWGKFYSRLKEKKHAFYKFATFHSFERIKTLLAQSGFSITRVVSTLFQKPGEVVQKESPREGYSANAGFTIIIADRS